MRVLYVYLQIYFSSIIVVTLNITLSVMTKFITKNTA